MTSTHIVIVNYNSGDWLERSVRSALEFSDGRVSVVDNLSTDNSVADCKAAISDKRVEWQLNDRNLGFAAANNQVLKNIESEFAILMNPDCQLNEDSLSQILEVMRKDTSIGLASCQILNEDGSLQATCRRRFPTPWSAFVRIFALDRLFPDNPRFANFDYGDQIDDSVSVEYVEAISGAFMVARISCVSEIGLLDEDYFMHCEDLDWCKRAHLNGWQVAFVPSARVVHAKGVSSKSRPIGVLYTLHTGMNRFFNKFYVNDYGLPLRLTVKAGIATSFIMRAMVSIFRGVLGR